MADYLLLSFVGWDYLPNTEQMLVAAKFLRAAGSIALHIAGILLVAL